MYIYFSVYRSNNAELILSTFIISILSQCPFWFIREQPFDFYGGGGGQEDLSEPENFFCLFLEQENFFRRPFGPDYFF